MSWLRKIASAGKSDAGRQSISNSSPSGTPRSSRSNSNNSNQIQTNQLHTQDTLDSSLSASSQARPRSNTDPETCLVVFKSHWAQALGIISKNLNGNSPAVRRSLNEEIEAVLKYADQMVLLMIEEEEDQGGQGPILQYLLEENILEQLLTWTNQAGADYTDRLKLHHLKMFEMMISQSRQSLFVHKPLIRPLLKLLTSCEGSRNTQIEARLILVLHQLCVCVTQNTQMLELLFSASSEQGPAKFVIFSLLIPYIHREGPIGQQARDALLLIMALSCVHDHIGIYIANNSDFCPVLATGLSGLYSSLERKLEGLSDDWHRLDQHDIQRMPDLTHFLYSLEFCNAVVQVAHPKLREQLLLFISHGFLRPQMGPDLFQVSHGLVRQQLVEFIYNGFLVPVIGPALHQDIFKLPISLVENYFASSMDEVIAATAYLELFVRTVTEPALIRTFLQFILTECHDGHSILHSLIARINSHSRLCMVTLSLFETLVNLNCEDVMYQLIFKYLIPCTHVMVSQRRAVKDVDLYSKTAEKLLTLKPACCTSDYQEPVGASGAATPTSHAASAAASANTSRSSSPTNTPNLSSSRRRLPFWKRDRTLSVDATQSMYSQATPDHFSAAGAGAGAGAVFGSKLEHYETAYMDYLRCVRPHILQCVRACQCWSAPYDGENPSPDTLLVTTDEHHAAKQQTQDSAPPLDSSPKNTSENTSENLKGSDCPNATDASHATAKDYEASDAKTLPCAATSEAKDSKDSKAGRLKAAPKEHYAESVVSEADSALSGSSTNTDSLRDHVPDSTTSASRTDSPLNDAFDNSEFTAFLASLQRVKTPVEFSDSFEACLQDIDSALDLATKQTTPVKTSSTSSLGDDASKSSSSASCGFGSGDATTKTRSWSSEGAESDGRGMSRYDSLLNLEAGGGAAALSQSAVKSSGAGTVFTPTKYNLGKPDIGPFLSTLLSKLECMMQNSLYVNLLLTGLVTRLAYYPQPLLRSFLLNHTLVFQPTVKSLVQVLGAVKHKVDCYSYQVAEFDALLLKARRFMAWREESVVARKHSLQTQPSKGATLADMHRERKKQWSGGSALGDFFRRNTPSRSSLPSPSQRVQLLGDKRGFRYIHHQPAPEPPANDLDTLKTKNAVYCALVLEEFVKELAAISQEHAVISAPSR